MFGRQAIRLLREAWGGVLAPDAQGALREKGAKQLAEELYAMFDDDIPLTHDGPITINKGSNAAPLTINNTVGGPSMVVQGGVDASGDFTVDGAFTVAGGPVTINAGDAADAGDEGDVNDHSIHLEGAALDLDFGDITINGEPLADYIASHGGGGGGGGGALLGIVTSGSDQTYSVALYGDGYDDPATASLTGVYAPAVADGEAIDPGTKLPVFLVAGTYHIFPPVWL